MTRFLGVAAFLSYALLLLWWIGSFILVGAVIGPDGEPMSPMMEVASFFHAGLSTFAVCVTSIMILSFGE